jgi:hypothetical protein
LSASARPPSASQTSEKSGEYKGIIIENLRGHKNDFPLDRNGFQVFGHPDAAHIEAEALKSSLTDQGYHSPEAIRKKYYRAVVDFIKKALNAETVVPFTHDVSIHR